jgi:hypothetical protein
MAVSETKLVPQSNQRCCNHCKQWKPLDQYYKSNRTKGGRALDCKVCHNEAVKRYRKSSKGKVVQRHYLNSPKWRLSHIRTLIKRDYGIEMLEQFNMLVDRYNELNKPSPTVKDMWKQYIKRKLVTS